jgi:hypothetical protein
LPALVADGSGRLWAAVAVPLNEGRGIYVTESADGMQSLSDPVAVFEAAPAGWGRVGPPRLALDQSGRLHLLWQRQTADGQGISLHASESLDGVTWSAATRVAENVGAWYTVVAARDGSVHRFWSAPQGGRQGLQHSYLINREAGWSRATALAGGEQPVEALADLAGQLHLLTLAEGAVTRRVWAGERWQVAERQALLPATESGEVAAVAGRNAQALWLAFPGAQESADAASAPGGVALVRHLLEPRDPLPGPAAVAARVAVPVSADLPPTPSPDTPAPTATPPPATPALDLTGVPLSPESAETNVTRPLLIGLALIPAVVVTGVTVAVILRRRAP